MALCLELSGQRQRHGSELREAGDGRDIGGDRRVVWAGGNQQVEVVVMRCMEGWGREV